MTQYSTAATNRKFIPRRYLHLLYFVEDQQAHARPMITHCPKESGETRKPPPAVYQHARCPRTARSYTTGLKTVHARWIRSSRPLRPGRSAAITDAVAPGPLARPLTRHPNRITTTGRIPLPARWWRSTADPTMAADRRPAPSSAGGKISGIPMKDNGFTSPFGASHGLPRMAKLRWIIP